MPLNETIINAVHAGTVRSVLEGTAAEDLSASEQAILGELSDAIDAIDSSVDLEIGRLSSVLEQLKLGSNSWKLEPFSAERPLRQLRLEVDRSTLQRVYDGLLDAGYRAIAVDSESAWRAVMATRSEVAFRSADTGFRLVLRWPANSLTRPRVGNLFRPTSEDFRIAPLPGPLWPLYSLLHIGRVATSRVRNTASPNLGPIFDTPPGLVSELLDFAGLQQGEVLVDLGSGDGRILIAAAKAEAPRCVGYEIDEQLVVDSRRLAAASGVAELVTVVHSDAAQADLSEASVVFVFLPAEIAGALIPDVLARMNPGARLVAHEQDPIQLASPKPETTRPLISNDGITVAHLWVA